MLGLKIRTRERRSKTDSLKLILRRGTEMPTWVLLIW